MCLMWQTNSSQDRELRDAISKAEVIVENSGGMDGTSNPLCNDGPAGKSTDGHGSFANSC